MEFQNRKNTRLRSYDYSSEGMYFLTICARDKEHLFGQIVLDIVKDVPSASEKLVGVTEIPRVILTRTGKIVEKYILSMDAIKDIHVEKYVIMPNHIHLLLSADFHDGAKPQNRQNQLIPRTIAVFKRLCNAEIGENVFQRSYHDHIIRGKSDYEKIWAYIDDNPRRWRDDEYYSGPPTVGGGDPTPRKPK